MPNLNIEVSEEEYEQLSEVKDAQGVGQMVECRIYPCPEGRGILLANA